MRLASHGPLTCKYNSLIRKFASKFVTLTSLLLFSHRTSKLDCESDQKRRRDETEAGSGQHFGREKKKKKKKFPGNDPAFLCVVCTHQSLEAVDLIDACPGGEGKARQRSESARETRHLRSSATGTGTGQNRAGFRASNSTFDLPWPARCSSVHSLTYFSFLPSPTSCLRGSLRTLGSFMAYASAFAFLSLGVLPFNVAGS